MANSTTNVDTISQSQASKEVTANAFFDAASVATTYGRRASTCSGLTWGYYGGNVVKSDKTLVQIANGTLTLTASTTNYVVAAKSSGAVSFSTATTNWNDRAGYWRLYSIVTGTATVTSYTDAREPGKFTAAAHSTVSTVAYAASLTLDCSTADIFIVTLTGDITIDFSNAIDGQKVQVILKQDATGNRLVTWGTSVAFGTDVATAVASTAANKTDYFGLHYNATAAKYHMMAVARGY